MDVNQERCDMAILNGSFTITMLAVIGTPFQVQANSGRGAEVCSGVLGDSLGKNVV